MELSSWLKYIGLALLLALLQTMLLNQMVLFHMAIPMVCPYLIMILPNKLSKSWILSLGFAYGLLLDFFDGTYGYFVLTTTLLAFLRPLLLFFFVSKEKREIGAPSLFTIDFNGWWKYSLTFLFLFNLVLFGIEGIGTSAWWMLSLKTITSTLFSWFIILLFEILFRRK